MPKFCTGSIAGLRVRGVLVGLIHFALCASSAVKADSFSITLHPTEQIGANGPYLSAPFDLGTAFSEIESVTLGFIMPTGYEGSAATTGNSSFTRFLKLLLRPTDTPIPEIWQNSPTSLGQSTFDMPAGAAEEFRFLYSVSFPGDDSPLDWPDFLFTGSGEVGWVDEFYSSHHPLPDGVPFTSSRSWLLPSKIQSAQLTIVGTPVPEPASVMLLAAGALTALACRRKWRVVSPRSTATRLMQPDFQAA